MREAVCEKLEALEAKRNKQLKCCKKWLIKILRAIHSWPRSRWSPDLRPLYEARNRAWELAFCVSAPFLDEAVRNLTKKDYQYSTQLITKYCYFWMSNMLARQHVQFLSHQLPESQKLSATKAKRGCLLDWREALYSCWRRCFGSRKSASRTGK